MGWPVIVEPSDGSPCAAEVCSRASLYWLRTDGEYPGESLACQSHLGELVTELGDSDDG